MADFSPCQIEFHLHRGEGLKAVDTNFGQSPTSDPYVVVEKFERNGKSHETKSGAPKWTSSVVTKNNKDPVWAEKTTFHCDNLKDVSLLITVYDHNDLLKHENLGHVEVRMDDLDFKKDARAVVPIKVAANIHSVLQDKKGKRTGKLGSLYYSIFLHPKYQEMIFMAEPLDKHLGPLISENTFLVRFLGMNGEPRLGSFDDPQPLSSTGKASMPIPFKKRRVCMYANYLGIFPIKENKAKDKDGKDLKDTATAPLYAPLGLLWLSEEREKNKEVGSAEETQIQKERERDKQHFATFKGEKKVTLVCKHPEGGFEISATPHDLVDFIDQIQKYGALSTEMDPLGKPVVVHATPTMPNRRYAQYVYRSKVSVAAWWTNGRPDSRERHRTRITFLDTSDTISDCIVSSALKSGVGLYKCDRTKKTFRVGFTIDRGIVNFDFARNLNELKSEPAKAFNTMISDLGFSDKEGEAKDKCLGSGGISGSSEGPLMSRQDAMKYGERRRVNKPDELILSHSNYVLSNLEHAYFLIDGTIRVEWGDAEEAEWAVEEITGPQFFGEVSLFIPQSFKAYAVTENCDFLILDYKRLLKYFSKDANGHFSQYFFEQTAKKMTRTIRRLQALHEQEIMDCRSILLASQPGVTNPSPPMPLVPSSSLPPPITLQRKRAVSGGNPGGSTFPIPVSIIESTLARDRDVASNTLGTGPALSPRDRNRWSEGRAPTSPRGPRDNEALTIASGGSRSGSPRSPHISPRTQANSPPLSSQQLLAPNSGSPSASRDAKDSPTSSTGLPVVASFATSSGGMSLTDAVRDLERERRPRSRDNSPRVSTPTSSAELTTISVTVEEGTTTKLASAAARPSPPQSTVLLPTLAGSNKLAQSSESISRSLTHRQRKYLASVDPSVQKDLNMDVLLSMLDAWTRKDFDECFACFDVKTVKYVDPFVHQGLFDMEKIGSHMKLMSKNYSWSFKGIDVYPITQNKSGRFLSYIIRVNKFSCIYSKTSMPAMITIDLSTKRKTITLLEILFDRVLLQTLAGNNETERFISLLGLDTYNKTVRDKIIHWSHCNILVESRGSVDDSSQVHNFSEAEFFLSSTHVAIYTQYFDYKHSFIYPLLEIVDISLVSTTTNTTTSNTYPAKIICKFLRDTHKMRQSDLVLYFRSEDEAKKNQLIMKLSWESIRQTASTTNTGSQGTALNNMQQFSSASCLNVEGRIRNSVNSAKRASVDKPEKDPSPGMTPVGEKRQSLELHAGPLSSRDEKANQNTAKDVSPGEPKKVVNEFDDFILQQNPHKNIWQIENIPLEFLDATRSVRVQSNDDPEDDSPVYFGDYVYGRVVSNYPMKATLQPDRTIALDSVIHMGDPVCDQFCVERYASATVFALADGCNWGNKPRMAANRASRAFVNFVQENTTIASSSSLLDSHILARSFIHAFDVCQKAILSESKDAKYFTDVGTTTLVGGAILEMSGKPNSWAVVCAGVGDCKIFHIALSGKKPEVSEITVGSRNIQNITDATDPGGRLGPQKKGGHPDLRNFDAWCHEVLTGDIILVVSDGVHDNLDPQSRGLDIQEFGDFAETETWTSVDPAIVSDIKMKAQNELILDLFEMVLNENKDILTLDLQTSGRRRTGTREDVAAPQEPRSHLLQLLTERIIEFCRELCKPANKFMETELEKKLPFDYKKYPGKQDHCSCVAIRVGHSNLIEKAQLVDKTLLRLFHKLQEKSRRQKNESFVLGSSCEDLSYTGQDIVNLLMEDIDVEGVEANVRAKKKAKEAMGLAQLMLNFSAIASTYDINSHDDFYSKAFDLSRQYKIKVYDVAMSHDDWKKMRAAEIFEKKTYLLGEKVVRQNDVSSKIFQIESGQCRVTLDSEPNRPIRILRKGDMFGEINFLEQARTTANVEPDGGPVTVHEIDREMLPMIFCQSPSLAGRFYHYLAKISSSLLRDIRAELAM